MKTYYPIRLVRPCCLIAAAIVCLCGGYGFFRLVGCDPSSSLLGSALWTWNPFTTICLQMSSVWAYWWMPLALCGLVLALAVLVAAGLGVVFGRCVAPPPPKAPADVMVVRPTPSVITALRDLARLESADCHVERVIDLKDHETWRRTKSNIAIGLMERGQSPRIPLGLIPAGSANTMHQELRCADSLAAAERIVDILARISLEGLVQKIFYDGSGV